MSKWLLGIAGVIGLIALLAFVTQGGEKTGENVYSEARRLIHEFPTGDQIIFEGNIQEPITEFIYQEKQVTTTTTLDNGTQIEKTETVIEKVPSSELQLSVQERQSGDYKVCRLGYQCDISGQITLIDPNTGKEIQPPYGFFLQIECINADHPVMTCNNFDIIVVQERTQSDKSFKYTFTPSASKNPPGDYMATVVITSKFKDARDQYIEFEGTQMIKMIA